tara:strand:+ start:54 stop:551 length:498 start_codon:yes stop_codon:yes gene_type:complete
MAWGTPASWGPFNGQGAEGSGQGSMWDDYMGSTPNRGTPVNQSVYQPGVGLAPQLGTFQGNLGDGSGTLDNAGVYQPDQPNGVQPQQPYSRNPDDPNPVDGESPGYRKGFYWIPGQGYVNVGSEEHLRDLESKGLPGGGGQPGYNQGEAGQDPFNPPNPGWRGYI